MLFHRAERHLQDFRNKLDVMVPVEMGRGDASRLQSGDLYFDFLVDHVKVPPDNLTVFIGHVVFIAPVAPALIEAEQVIKIEVKAEASINVIIQDGAGDSARVKEGVFSAPDHDGGPIHASRANEGIDGLVYRKGKAHVVAGYQE
jgi:hypothetical protein